jgi:plastocyanin
MQPRGKRWFTTALTAAGLFVAGGLGGAAQDATPGDASAHAHPAHIHLGTCDELDPNPTFPLTDNAPGALLDDAVAIPVERSLTTVEATVEDLRTGGYAINVHQSRDDIGTYIACGSLSGTLDDNGALIVGLGELNDSGHSGVAVLTEQEGQTEVTVYLTAGASGDASTAASATDGDEAAMADATAVEIVDFAYVPDPVEIPAGATVTWTNNDTVPHTATAQARAALQSGTLDPGASFSQTFAEPGTFDYFCEFHANMKGTIVVQ